MKLSQLLIGTITITNTYFTASQGPSRGTGNEIDLYIRDKYETSDGSRCDDTSSCNTSENCYRASRTLFLRKQCFNRGIDKSSIYDEVSANVVCRQDFRTGCSSSSENNDNDNELEFDAESLNDCRSSWQLKECVNSERMTRLSNWCIESTQAMGEFTVPLLNFREYESASSCRNDASSSSGEYTNLYLPDMGGVCISYAFKKAGDGMYTTGSRQVSCKGNVYRSVRYDSSDCTGDDFTLMKLDGTSDQCPADYVGNNDDEELGLAYTVNCNAPTIYCKGSISFSGREGSFVSDESDEGGTNAAAAQCNAISKWSSILLLIATMILVRTV